MTARARATKVANVTFSRVFPLLVSFIAGSLPFACTASSEPTQTPPSAEPSPDAGGQVDSAVDASTVKLEVTLLAHVDLPRNAGTRALSGTVYDEASRTLLAVQDTGPGLVPFVIGEDFQSVTAKAPQPLTGRMRSGWDGEGITRVGSELFVLTEETVPTLERFDLEGRALGQVVLPAVFAEQRSGNKGIEALSASPSGKALFFANEQALLPDGSGPSKSTGTVVRLVKRDLPDGAFHTYAYRTEPLGAGTSGDMGVSEVLAISDERVLVLERGYQSDFGNTVRLFLVDLSAASELGELTKLPADVTVLPKVLLSDLGKLECATCTHPGKQDNPLLDNFEALALGPLLPDGRRVIFVTSDDNSSSTQVARVVVLAVRGI